MSRRNTFILGGGVLAGLTLISFVVLVLASQTPKESPPRPELGGQKVPGKHFEIEFAQKYDLFCSFYGTERTIYNDCKILGFTGDDDESARSRRASRSGGFAFVSSVSSGSYYNHFERWLVLELSDGRLAYIPPTAVKYIEQASSRGK